MDLSDQLLQQLLNSKDGRLSLLLTDQGMLEYLLSSWVNQMLQKNLRQGFSQILVLGEPYKEVSNLEMVLERNTSASTDQLLALPTTTFWGANRYANQSNLLHQRIRAIYSIHRRLEPGTILASPRSFAQTISEPAWVDQLVLRLKKGEERDMDELIEALIDLGYVEAELVNEPGYYAQRGGIIDVFASQLQTPFRLEFFGDTIMSIRPFDATSQRSFAEVEELEVFLALETPPVQSRRRQNVQRLYDELMAQDIDRHERQGMIDAFQKGYIFPGYHLFQPLFRTEARTSLFELIAPDQLVILLQSQDKIIEDYQAFYDELLTYHDEDISAKKPSLHPSFHFLTPTEFTESLSKLPYLVELKSQAIAAESQYLVSGRSQLDPQDRALLATQGEDALAGFVKFVNKANYSSIIVVHELDQAARIAHLLEHQNQATSIMQKSLLETIDQQLEPEKVHICQGYLSEWVFLQERQLLIMPDFAIFGANVPRKPRIKSQRQLQSLLSSFRDLAIGSPVVHIEHGIGRYSGIQTLELSGIKNDFLIIEYACQDKVYVPVDRLNMVQKYSAGDGSSNPPLDRLKSQGWIRRKGKVKKAIRDLADQLLQIQARRKLASRPVFSEPSDLYFQFEVDFPYDETEDQLQAITDVNQDFGRSVPMDRLICGDVGFGKTEVALRAAMRAVLDGWQVVVLAPTTVLSFQHFKTFENRFQKYGVTIGLLNRFVSSKNVKATLERFSKGQLDILIGTHRILSKDVKPKNLGLVIIDEEQRFGVSHKEAIKDLRAGCDVLTLTATPIPRSLHMAMLGLRDISVIMTPPVERLAIKTFVAKFDPLLIKKGVERELQRGGQIFFVHNRVEDILQVRSYLLELMPGVDIRVAHGQMREHELERVMVDFIEGKFPVLLCTTIIESGLDIPNVNTIFVNRAEHFGLAQLYQMRGRVGRSSRQSYAYFLTHAQTLPVDAERRLEILAAHQELGSGFQIANYDLEMRGAGNLLGGEQSGHIADVGLELYTNLLHEEIMRMRDGTVAQTLPDTEIKLAISATIPPDYISSESQRLSLYKSLFSSEQVQEVQQLAKDTEDRFGKMPGQCLRIFKIAEIKILLRAIKASSIVNKGSGIFEIKFHSLSEAEIATITEVIGKQKAHYQLRPDFSLLITIKDKDSESHLDRDSEILDQLIGRLQPLSYQMMKAKQ